MTNFSYKNKTRMNESIINKIIYSKQPMRPILKCLGDEPFDCSWKVFSNKTSYHRIFNSIYVKRARAREVCFWGEDQVSLCWAHLFIAIFCKRNDALREMIRDNESNPEFLRILCFDKPNEIYDVWGQPYYSYFERTLYQLAVQVGNIEGMEILYSLGIGLLGDPLKIKTGGLAHAVIINRPDSLEVMAAAIRLSHHSAHDCVNLEYTYTPTNRRLEPMIAPPIHSITILSVDIYNSWQDVFEESMKKLQFLIDHGANVMARTRRKNETALHFIGSMCAASSSIYEHDTLYYDVCSKYIRFIVEHAKSMSDGKDSLKSFLDAKCMSERVNRLQNGIRVIFYFYRMKSTEIIAYLLENGCSAEHKDDDVPPLLVLCTDLKPGRSYELMRLLLSYNVDVNTRNHYGKQSPLYRILQGWWAKMYQREVELLLEYGAEMNSEEIRHLKSDIVEWLNELFSSSSSLYFLK